jgi:hypothetical protein
MPHFILVLHTLCPDLVLFLRHVRSCGCLNMIFGTRPHGHRPRLCSFVTFTPSLLTSTGSRRAEQLSQHSQQRVVATVEDSVLRTEMAGIESQEEDAPKRILFFKTMS